jgi:urease accessory protein
MIPWRVLQLADAAFPTGGFAHSAGLEAAVHLGEVGAVGLRAFLEQSLWQMGLAGLPFVRAAHRSPDDLPAHDGLAEAFLTNHVARRASVTQGRALAATLSRVFRLPALHALDARIRERGLHGHHAPLFGAALAALDLPIEATAQLFVHQGLRGVVSAAVRLGLVGPHEAQRHLDELAPLAGEVIEASRDRTIADAAQPAPLQDLFGATHDRLYARLFQS